MRNINKDFKSFLLVQMHVHVRLCTCVCCAHACGVHMRALSLSLSSIFHQWLCYKYSRNIIPCTGGVIQGKRNIKYVLVHRASTEFRLDVLGD